MLIKYMELLKSKKSSVLVVTFVLAECTRSFSSVVISKIIEIIFSDNSDHVMLILLPVLIRDIIELRIFDRAQWLS